MFGQWETGAMRNADEARGRWPGAPQSPIANGLPETGAIVNVVRDLESD